jgi:TonB-dependent starch-binding outer membrane protein SusC
MRKLTVLLVLLLFTGMQVVFAQQRAVTGRVATADNTPLPGVTVVVKGTTTGTATDANGGFSISVPNNQAVLQFSFIGFNTRK